MLTNESTNQNTVEKKKISNNKPSTKPKSSISKNSVIKVKPIENTVIEMNESETSPVQFDLSAGTVSYKNET